ncbi:MAG TPA: SDR family NAD(P)-dependent oxidoreductase [Candidatus Binatia bacterium]|nr:SDR family NAD(P)-dependent oxidoreductase [Candidatus Binatia bacterium]
MGKLDGRIALVTGSSRGIGRGIALAFAAEGANVVVNYRRDEPAARETVGAIEALGRKAVAIQADVAEWPQVQALVGRALDHFGRLDIVVANSGVASRVQPVWDLDVEHWHKVIGVNLHGVFYTCKATAKHLVDRQQGTIILISSIGADACGPLGAPYYCAKAAVNALTKSLAKECAPSRVRVNCIAPGLVMSDMGDRMVKFYGDALIAGIPLGRPGQPEDIGKAAVYLASDDADFVTGKILRVDGGAWM